MTDIIAIPLNRLVASSRNVRKTGGMAIDDLAASIHAHGLLQNLTVIPTRAADKFEVVAGGRRLRALQQLVKSGYVPTEHPVLCKVVAIDNASEASLAENVLREAMHPADQFEAFQALVESGRTTADVAASFGVDEKVVRQRLKLAKVAPELLQAYRDNQLDLEALEAFTLADDHATQLQVWAAATSPWQREARNIREKLTAKEVNARSSRRAKLVGIPAYEAAGGKSRTDLFGGDIYLDNPELLHRLADDMLQDCADRLRAEGWKWVTVATENAETWRYEKKRGKRQPLTAEEDHELAAVREQVAVVAARLNELEAVDAERGDSFDDDDDLLDRITALQDELNSLNGKADELARGTETWSSKTKAIAGAIVELDYSGRLVIHRGLVKPADAKRAEKEAKAKTKGNAAPASSGDELSEALLRRLQAHRTSVLKLRLAENEHVALAVLAYHLLQSAFGVRWYSGLGQMSLHPVDAGLVRVGVADDYAPRQQLYQLTEGWRAEIPDEPVAALRWLIDLEPTRLQLLLATCTAIAFDATTGRTGDHNPEPAMIDMLCGELGVDMAQHWRPTVDSYLGHVSKPMIRAAVLDAGYSQQAADALMGLKKGGAAAEAESIMSNSTWLPVPLRRLPPPVPAAKKGGRKAKA